MRLLDEQYTRTPFYGVLRMTAYLRRLGHGVNPKRVRRLLRLMGLGAVYPKPNTSQAHPRHNIYPYLLRGWTLIGPSGVERDITYSLDGVCVPVAVTIGLAATCWTGPSARPWSGLLLETWNVFSQGAL